MSSAWILGVGAATPIGLSAAHTCAAFRARLSGYTASIPRPPPDQPLLAARVPAAEALRQHPEMWLAQLAARAAREALLGLPPDGRCRVWMCVAEESRHHPGLLGGGMERMRAGAHALLEDRLAAPSEIVRGGQAAAYQALKAARAFLAGGADRFALVGGVDSLLGARDVWRYLAMDRLHRPGTPQGFVPGEGAAFVLLGAARPARQGAHWVALTGVGVDRELDTVEGERFSNGVALRRALEAATREAGARESEIALRVTDMNGERYRAWESAMAANRFYRTRRAESQEWHVPSCTGDIGAAAAPLGWVIAAHALARGYVAGRVVACEGSSDDGLRGAAIVQAAAEMPAPPFRTRTYALDRTRGAWPVVPK